MGPRMNFPGHIGTNLVLHGVNSVAQPEPSSRRRPGTSLLFLDPGLRRGDGGLTPATRATAGRPYQDRLVERPNPSFGATGPLCSAGTARPTVCLGRPLTGLPGLVRMLENRKERCPGTEARATNNLTEVRTIQWDGHLARRQARRLSHQPCRALAEKIPARRPALPRQRQVPSIRHRTSAMAYQSARYSFTTSSLDIIPTMLSECTMRPFSMMYPRSHTRRQNLRF